MSHSNPYRVDAQLRECLHPHEIANRELQAEQFAAIRDALEQCKKKVFEHRELFGAAQRDEFVADNTLASILLTAIEDTIGSEAWISYLADLLRSTSEEARSGPDGFVYVLKAGNYYKIGRTVELSSRIKTLKIQLPFPAKVWQVIPCEDHVAAERWLHDFFSKWRVNGEWFELPVVATGGWLANCRYMTNARGDYAEYSDGIDQHDRVPEALRGNERWNSALLEAAAALEVCDE